MIDAKKLMLGLLFLMGSTAFAPQAKENSDKSKNIKKSMSLRNKIGASIAGVIAIVATACLVVQIAKRWPQQQEKDKMQFLPEKPEEYVENAMTKLLSDFSRRSGGQPLPEKIQATIRAEIAQRIVNLRAIQTKWQKTKENAAPSDKASECPICTDPMPTKEAAQNIVTLCCQQKLHYRCLVKTITSIYHGFAPDGPGGYLAINQCPFCQKLLDPNDKPEEPNSKVKAC